MFTILFPVFIIAVILNALLFALLITVIEQRYPEIYDEYNRPSKLFAAITESHFLGEFVVGGCYKFKINKEDYKYIKWAQASLLIVLIVFVVQVSLLVLDK